ncbi:hypothetical protein NX059_004003 [Plenodomus lindquistii]|nr:hypothetical protein NX059_004003 [Plenodomus lindquistii]
MRPKCNTLSQKFPNQIFLRTETGYEVTRNSFWSTIQGAYTPTCFFRPKNSEEVSRAVVASSSAHCNFAVKSGGHASFESSTIQDGLVVDLADLNEVVVSQDKKSAFIGPGGRWHEVYPRLQEYNVSVPGGRQFGVGVGGFTLGGGISFLSNLHGWACDNILEFEVVLANGVIVKANPTSHKDLYWALRGGGSNFGIVTKFKFMAYEQGLLWASIMSFNSSNSRVVHDAYTTWGRDLVQTDPRSHALVVWDAFTNSTPTAAVTLLSTDPFEIGTHPKVYDQFYEAGPVTTLELNGFQGDIAESQVIPGSVSRNTFWTTSWLIDADMTQMVFEIWAEETKSIAPLMVQQQLQHQTLTVAQMEIMKRNGGNPLGLAGQERALGFMNVLARWDNVKDDEIVYQTFQRIEDRVNTAAEQKGVTNGFIYTNYASQFQDPFASYGAANKKRLLKIAKKYDPKGVFQNLVSGGHKLTGPQS